MQYVKLGQRASSFFDPSQEVGSRSMSNHTQVLAVKDSPLVTRFLKSEGLLKATKEEFDEYTKAENERREAEKNALLAKKGLAINSTPSTSDPEALAKFFEVVQEATGTMEVMKQTIEEQKVEIQLLKESNETLTKENESLAKSLNEKEENKKGKNNQ